MQCLGLFPFVPNGLILGSILLLGVGPKPVLGGHGMLVLVLLHGVVMNYDLQALLVAGNVVRLLHGADRNPTKTLYNFCSETKSYTMFTLPILKTKSLQIKT